MKELTWITFAFLTVFAISARAETVTYTWDAVNKRVDGTPTDGSISYVVRHNDGEHATEQTSITLEGFPTAGSDSCVAAVETHATGLKMRSAWACVTIKARPEPPTFRMIQLLE